MPGTTPNISRDTLDAAKARLSVRLQAGVPFTDADFNEAQDLQAWAREEQMAALLGWDSSSATPSAPLELVTFGPVDIDTSWPPSPFTALSTWSPGSFRPYVFDAGESNDMKIMWGPGWVQGLWVADVEGRGTAFQYTSVAHVITDGALTSAPSGMTITDSFKDWSTPSLHLLAASGGVGNGSSRPCQVRFTSGAEAGNVYGISATPGSTQLTLAGSWAAGGPANGDTYDVLPSTLDFVDGQNENVWLCVWVEDVGKEQDSDLEEPTMLVEPSHRFRIRKWLRVLRNGGNLPTSSAAPVPADPAPQQRENHVYWVKVATIAPAGGDAPLVTPDEFTYTGAGDGVRTIPGLLDAFSPFDTDHDGSTGHHRNLRVSDGIGQGAAAAADQHGFLLSENEGVRPDSASSPYAIETWVDVQQRLFALGSPRSEPLLWMGSWAHDPLSPAEAQRIILSGDLAAPRQSSSHPSYGQAAFWAAAWASTDTQMLGLNGTTYSTSLAALEVTANDDALPSSTASNAEAAAALFAYGKVPASDTLYGSKLEVRGDPAAPDNQIDSLVFDSIGGVPGTALAGFLVLRSGGGIVDALTGLYIEGKKGAGRTHTAYGTRALQVVSGGARIGEVVEVEGAFAWHPHLDYDHNLPADVLHNPKMYEDMLGGGGSLAYMQDTRGALNRRWVDSTSRIGNWYVRMDAPNKGSVDIRALSAHMWHANIGNVDHLYIRPVEWDASSPLPSPLGAEQEFNLDTTAGGLAVGTWGTATLASPPPLPLWSIPAPTPGRVRYWQFRHDCPGGGDIRLGAIMFTKRINQVRPHND